MCAKFQVQVSVVQDGVFLCAIEVCITSSLCCLRDVDGSAGYTCKWVACGADSLLVAAYVEDIYRGQSYSVA